MSEPFDRGEEKPPSRRMKRYWKIAILANIKDDDHPKPEGVPPDAFADFDHIETVDSLRAALETDGHSTVFIQADRDLPYALKEVKPDICFNIAEGLGGDAREAQVPALLEMFGIPYTGSRVLTNGIPLIKPSPNASGVTVACPLLLSRNLVLAMSLYVQS